MRKLGLWLSLCVIAPAAQAAAYVFPGNLPAGCTGSGPSYTCTGLTLASGDTVAINSPSPATITVNGALNATGASINSGGSAANLTLNVTGAVTLTTSSIVGNVNSVGATLNTGSSITGNLAAGAATITMGASTTVSGNVSCTGTCYLGMSANDITIGGTTTVGYLQNSGYYRARFGGTITASYAYIHIGYDATVTGNVQLNATHGTTYSVYLGDRSTVSGNISSAQTGGIFLYGSSQVSGNVSISNATGGGTGLSNNIYMYAAAKVIGNVSCSNCQLDLQGSNTDVGGTTSVGSVGNTTYYSSYTGAKFGSLLVSPSGNSLTASNGQILLGNTSTITGGVSATQSITAGTSLNVAGSVSAGGAVNIGATSVVTGNLQATGAVTLGNSNTVNGSITSSSSVSTGTSTIVQGSLTASSSVTMGTTAAVTGSISAGSGVTLGTGSSVGQNLSGGNGTITLNANTTISGNVSCNTTCYLGMSANDITIGGTTTVGYLYNWGYYRARFGGTITASYAYIYIGYDATVTGNVQLNATHASSYAVYLGDRSTVSGNISSAQTGGIYLYGSSQVSGNVSISNATGGGTGLSNNIYMYAAAKVIGNVACSNCQLDLQGSNTDVGGTTSVGSVGNTSYYSSYTGAKFGSLLVSPSGNTLNATNGQILLGGTTTVKGGVYASQAITTGASLNVTGSVTAGGAINLGASATITADLVSSTSITTATNTTVQGSVTAASSVNMGTTALITGGISAGAGVTLGASSSVGQNLSGGSGTITLNANTTISGNVSCNTTCYLGMSANDITIGGTTTVGYLYNWGYYRARFGGTITASYAYIYIGYDATVTGNVQLNATHATSYGVYLGDRSTVSGNISSAQTGGIYLYGSSQVTGNVSITNATGGGTNLSNNIYMYAAAKVIGNVACSNCQLDLQGSNTDVGGTTSVGSVGNTSYYSSYTGAKFGSLLVSPSGNTLNATNGQILLGGTTTVKGGVYASQAITTGASLNVTGSVTAGGAINLGASATITADLVSSSSITTSTNTTVQGSVTAASTVNMGTTALITGGISAGSGVTLGASSSVGQNLSGGSGTITLNANTSISGNVSCNTTCYLGMSANDITIGGTTTVGYLYNWGYYRARFGGNITASYAYIYIGYDAVVNGDVRLNATYASGYAIYVGDRTVVNGSVISAQTGGIIHYASSTSQCTRTLSSGTITLNTSSRPSGVCCASAGFGSSCSSSCVSNSSGLTMPTGCRAQEAFLGEAARYQFEEAAWTAGGSVQDSSGYERHGTITGSPTQSRVAPPTCGTTYGVFASGQRIKVPYHATLNPTSFTVAHWARVDGGANTFRGSVTSRTGAASITGYNIYASSANNWQFWTGSPTGAFAQLTGPAVTNGVWTHVAVTYQVASGPDASGVYTGTGTIYVNGVASGTNTSMRYKPNTSSPLVIGSGGNEDADFAQYPFIGALDDVRVFDYALSASEVAALRTVNCPGGLPGSVWWSRANSITGQSDNTAVNSWSNEVDTAKNLSPSAVAPKFRNSNALNINFNPVVEFTSTTATDAAAQYFRANSLLGSKTWARSHVALVGYPRNNTQYNFLWWEQTVLPAGYAEGRFSGHLPWATMMYWDAGNCCSTNRIGVVDTTNVNAPSVYLFHMDTTSASPGGVKQGIRRNGVLLGSTAAPVAFTGLSAEFRLGFRGPAVINEPFQGVLSEGMLLLGQTLTDSLATQLESYLSVKYGITLGGNGAAGTSYAHSGGTTTWSAGTGFHNNVTGLGRDDATKLSQLISRSSNTGAQITLTTGATMPSTATAVAPTSGVAFSADRSFVLVGDNGLSPTATAYIAAGPQAGRARSARVWRAQVTGTVPTQMAVCVPESMIPAEFLGGNAASDLWLTTASSADFATGASSFTMTATNCVASGVGVTDSVAGRLAVVPSATLQAWGGVGYFTVSRRLLDHLEITANSSSGVTCAPTSYTIKACADAACTSLYTGGVSGTLTLSGSGLTVNFPAGAGFSIPSGSSQTTVSAQVTTPGTATVGVTGLSITPGNTQNVFCGLGATAAAGNSCAMTVADAGLLFDVPHHRSGVSQTITLSAVKKADNSLACAPAFTGAKSVNFKCQYQNPVSGTLPVLVGGVGLNAAAVTTSACDATGANRTLTFDANGQTTTTVQYLDVGQVKLSASWTGTTGADNGLNLRGEDSFIAAPMTFNVQPAATAQVAGTTFGVTVTATNAAGTAVPNFGLETVPERPTLVLHRAKPTGVGAQDGVFTAGTAGSVSNGVVSFSGLSWTEVGAAEVLAKLQSGSYLGSGLSAMKTTGGWAICAYQGNTCTLPAGVTATVSFDAGGSSINYKHGVSGAISCTAASFPADPAPAASKSCWYTLESGSSTATNDPGTLVFKPHHFDVTTAAACGSFSYAAQPFTTTVTARNAQGGVTRNYDGSADTSPNYAKTVNMSLASANATGTLSSSVAPSSFVAGVGATMSSFSFVNKLTPEQTISLRATDTDGVSSNTFAEGSMVLRSGRLVLSNAFGSEKSPLQIPMQLQYWSGKSWVLNSSDTCTVISPNSVVRAQTLNHNNTNATWTSAVSGVSLAGGSGFITLGAPSGGGTGSVDLAVNLGVGPASADLSCLASHPNSTGAGLPWLRSRQGSCTSTFDRDPSARATFGIYAPETKRSVHVREVF